MKKRTLLLSLFSFVFLADLIATHNVAGTITYKQLDDNTIEGSVITYTNSNAISSSRDSLLLCWGDGNCEMIVRVNGPDNDMNGVPDGEPLDSFFNINIYTSQHTFDEFGQYTMSMTDPNRSGGILNLNFPNSDMVPFYIETEFKLSPLPLGETNQSPVILEPPIIRAFVDLPYAYTPNAFDIDGDSLVYELTAPADVPNYEFPCHINTNPPGPNICILDQKKGLFNWNSPQVPGLYVVAIAIKSYKEGELKDQMILDFLIYVEDDPDIYPDIEIENISGNEIIPVNVGDTMYLDISVADPDNTQEIEITSSSGLYDYFDNPATFEAVTNGNFGTATFEWIVLEEHVREQPYQVVIKAKDNDLEYSKTALKVVCYQFEEFITSTQSPEKEFDFELFPNPALHGKIYMTSNDYLPGYQQFTIYDTQGKLLKNGKITSGNIEIDVQNFAPGIYFLKVDTDKNTSTKSFVIP